jgi:hypothetical protein
METRAEGQAMSGNMILILAGAAIFIVAFVTAVFTYVFWIWLKRPDSNTSVVKSSGAIAVLAFLTAFFGLLKEIIVLFEKLIGR